MSTRTPATLPDRRYESGRWALARRMWQRLWPLPAIYFAMFPAGLIRAFADEVGLPVRADFNAVERFLYAPEQITALQRMDLEWLRLGAASIYASWFVLPLIVAFPVLVFRPHDFWRLGALLVVVYYASMPLFMLYPLTPPWLAYPEIDRTLTQYFQQVGRDANQFAAMPSLHAAMPAAAALWYGWRHPYGRVLWVYAGMVGFSVVYTGEHYMIDVLAGFAFAVAVHRACVALGLPFVRPTAAPWREAAEVNPLPLRLPKAS